MARWWLLVQHVYIKRNSSCCKRSWKRTAHTKLLYLTAKALDSHRSTWIVIKFFCYHIILINATLRSHWTLSNSEASPRIWVGLKPGMGNEEMGNEEMRKWRNKQMTWAKLGWRTAVLPARLNRVVVGWQDTEERQIMGVTPTVRGLIALTVTSSESTEPMERVWKVLLKGGKCTRCAYV